MLPPSSDRCPRCQNVAQIHWRRQYKTGHFFFFPLFSFGEQISATCTVCGYSVYGRPPYPIPKMPFLDRSGILVPFIVLGGGMLAFFVFIGIAVATAPPPPPPTPEHKEVMRLEEHLLTGTTWGEGPGAQELADAVCAALVVDRGFKKAELGVITQITEPAPRRVFIDIQYSHLSDVTSKGREDLIVDLRAAIGDKLHEGDRVVITVKGLLLTGVLATGTTETDWDIDIDGSIDDKKVEAALRGVTDGDAGAKLVASASASAAPASVSASASAAPSASASAVPPKKKRKPKPKAATE